MFSALAFSALSLALAGTPVAAVPPGAQQLELPQETAPICPGAPALGLPDEPVPQATCTAECWDLSEVSCGGSSCEAVDSDCANGVQGYVNCGGLIQLCPRCPRKAYCNCHTPDGYWGRWEGGQCALKPCILPIE
jgi:hypothetical protein